MTQPILYVITVGTSVYTNLRNAGRSWPPPPAIANVAPAALTPEQAHVLAEFRAAAAEGLAQDAATQKKLSAEMAAQWLYPDFPPEQRQGEDMALLIATDTALGLASAEALKTCLESAGLPAAILESRDLITGDNEQFQSAVSDLAKEIREQTQLFRQRDYRIVFNLNGGFKSVSGFLQALAMIMADEVLYTFEGSGTLLRVPSLPISLHFNAGAVQSWALRRLSARLPVAEADLQGIPGTMLLRIGGEVTLSAFGEALLPAFIPQMQVLEPLNDHIVYGPRFEESVEVHDLDRITIVNRQLDRLAAALERGRDPGNAVDLHRSRHPTLPEVTHQIDAWSDQDAQRIFGTFDGRVFTALKLDRKLP